MAFGPVRLRLLISGAMLALGAGLLGAAFAQAGADTSKPKIKNGGTFRIALSGPLGPIDPAVADPGLLRLPVLEVTCARLMAYPDKPPPEGFRLVPEVAAGNPRIANNGKTYTFTLRRSFRFSDGKPVRASAFARAITRTLLVAGDAPTLFDDIVGAGDVKAGRATSASGIRATGKRLVVALTRRTPDLPARMTTPAACAVPPNLPADPEGVARFATAGPYSIADHVRGRRLVLERNRFYHGNRPHHVTRFRIDGQVGSFDEVLDRVERGQADWGPAPAAVHLDPVRNLAKKYGVNRARFWLKPGLALRQYVLNASRPLFRDARLRRAVNYAIDRGAVRARFGGTRESSRLTDHYLPPGISGYGAARIYPHNLRIAKRLAKGHTGGGKAALYTPDRPPRVAAAQVIQQNLKKIGLDVTITKIPPGSYFERLDNPAEPYDLAEEVWGPDYPDPYAYLNLLFDGQSDTNLSHFDSKTYNKRLRRAARLQGGRRYREYAKLDVQLARDAAPSVAIDFLNEATLVSKRVDRRCIVLRPLLDLAAVCLR